MDYSLKPLWAHLFVAEVSLVEADPWQLVVLTDVEHGDRVTPVQQLLHQVSAQETRAPDNCAPFVTLNEIQRTPLYKVIDNVNIR